MISGETIAMWAAFREDRAGSYVMVPLWHCLGRPWAKSSDPVRVQVLQVGGRRATGTDQILCVTFAVGGFLYILCEAKTASVGFSGSGQSLTFSVFLESGLSFLCLGLNLKPPFWW